MLYIVKNVSNQMIVCTLADGTTLYLYSQATKTVQVNQMTDYLRRLAKEGIIIIEEALDPVNKKEETVVEEKKKSPKSENKNKEEK